VSSRARGLRAGFIAGDRDLTVLDGVTDTIPRVEQVRHPDDWLTVRGLASPTADTPAGRAPPSAILLSRP
jgi:hypothetical protein